MKNLFQKYGKIFLKYGKIGTLGRMIAGLFSALQAIGMVHRMTFADGVSAGSALQCGFPILFPGTEEASHPLLGSCFCM